MEKSKNVELEIRQEVGSRIAEIRKRKNLSAETVAKSLGVSREAVTQVERGRNNINAVALWKLAALLGCNVEDFFPQVPDGYGLTPLQRRKLEQEAPGIDAWAKQLWPDKKRRK